MAANQLIDDTAKNTMIDAFAALLNGGTIELYDGTQPAGPATAVTTQTKGVTLTLSATAFAAASGGVAASNTITGGVAIASITPTWARWKTSGGVARMDCTVGTSGCNINGVGAFTSGTTVNINGYNLTHPA